MMERANTIVERWKAMAAQHADRVAVVDGERQLTYAELERRAARLAADLVGLGVGPECRVGLCVQRSAEMIVAILAILEAGGAYVPLDPAYPAARLEYLVDDARPTLLLHDASASAWVSASGVPALLLDGRSGEPAGTPREARAARLLPDNLAYVIYTSGSTGNPKGSSITHRNVLRLFAVTEEAFEFGPDDVWPLLHSYAFDFSVWEIFGALLYGGRLVIPTSAEVSDPSRLLAFLVRHAVTVLNQTPSFFQQFCQFLEEAPAAERAGLRPSFIVFGGERLSFAALRSWYDLMGDEAVLVNMYGITEATVHVTLYPLSRHEAERETASVIGSPIGDLRLHLLDEQLRPVPQGATGELFVEGPGLMRGYHRRPRATAEAFIPCPFSETPGARMYRTGDLARVDGEGRLVYLGRQGGYVKIRGFRVSLAEIEAALRTCVGVRAAVVLTREHDGSTELDAWIVGAGGAGTALTPSGLRRELGEKVPVFLIPHRFYTLEALPLTTNGKVDAEQLRTSGVRLVDAAADGPGESEAEAEILAIWRRALDHDALSVGDDFFAAGGDSICAVVIVLALRRAGWDATVQDVFQAPTVRALAARIQRARPAEDAAAPPIALAGDAGDPASDLQAIMIDRYARHAAAGSGIYHSQQSFTVVDRALDADRLRRCFERECGDDPSFRVRFEATAAGLVRVREAEPLVELRSVDLAALSPDEQAARLLAHERADLGRPFEPMRAGAALMRIAVFRLSADAVRVFVSTHHAVDDGWGFQRFVKRVFDAYRGEAVPAPSDRRDPFASYVELQRRALADPAAVEHWARYPIAPASLVPVARPVPAAFDEEGCGLSAEAVRRVVERARDSKVQAKALFLAAALEAIGEVTGMADVTVGVVVNGRVAELPETLEATGLYWNLQPFTWAAAAGATRAVREIHERVLREERYAMYPLSAICATQGGDRELRFTFNYTNFPALGARDGLEIQDWKGVDTFHYPINLGVHIDMETGDHVARITCDPAMCSADERGALLRALVRAIERVGAGAGVASGGREGARSSEGDAWARSDVRAD